MGVFGKLRERSHILQFLVNAQKTVWYPILFAALSVISGTHDHTVYLPILYVLCALVLFSVLFTDDNKVFLTPLVMIYYCLGFDNPPSSFSSSGGEMLASFDSDAFKCIIGCAVVTVGAFIIRLIADGSIAAAFKKSSLLSRSILGLSAAFILNGAFSAKYDVANLGWGLFIAFGITAVYFLVHGMLDRSVDVLPYACQIMVCLSYTVLGQATVISYRAYQNGIFFTSSSSFVVNRYLFFLSWGVATVIGAVLVLGIPAALYLAKNHKHGWFSYLSAIIFIIEAFIINTRSAIIVGCVIFVIAALTCCVSGKRKIHNLIYFILFVVVPISVICFAVNSPSIESEITEKIIAALLRKRSDSGRIALWENGISDFLSSPWFGVGFADGGYVDEVPKNVFSKMYHCIGIEFLGATGIAGCLAFAFHLFALARLLIKRFSSDRMMLMMIPAMIIGMTIVDNFFFYLNFQIIYSVFLVIAERHLASAQA